MARAQAIVREFLSSGQEIELTERQARLLLGRGGRTIRELQDATGTEISNEEADKFIIYGSEKAKENAMKRIHTIIGKIDV